MINLLLLILCVLIFSACDYFAAKWGYSRDTGSMVIALVLGPIAYLFFGYLAATTSLSKMGSYVCVGIILCSVLAGFVLLGERPNRTTWLALAVIVVGLTMLSFGKVDRSDV